MFCPKCGTENPAEGKFCRKCGTDISVVSEALTGNLKSPATLTKTRKGEAVTWEGAMGKLFMGLAFFAVSIILGVTGAANGRTWWFWMLIPAFGMFGAGVAQIIRLKQEQKERLDVNVAPANNVIGNTPFAALPPTQTNYVIPAGSIYETGELVERPPSVIEGTTRHLEINKEGETITLPKK